MFRTPLSLSGDLKVKSFQDVGHFEFLGLGDYEDNYIIRLP